MRFYFYAKWDDDEADKQTVEEVIYLWNNATNYIFSRFAKQLTLSDIIYNNNILDWHKCDSTCDC